MKKYLITYQLLASQATTAPSISKIVEMSGLTAENLNNFMKEATMTKTQRVAIIYIKELEG